MSSWLSRGVTRLCLLTAAILLLQTAAARAELVAAEDVTSLLGAHKALGAVIWSHGRSSQVECDRAPTPDYIEAFRNGGWDIFRLNRPSGTDTMPTSSAALTSAANSLKQQGYRRVVLAGQSFGAFLSLTAAGGSDAVDAVIGTAPAAYGSAYSNPMGYGRNATGLYDLLGSVRRARVALFFFDGDIFDPGGRAVVADQILSARGLPHLVIDRPEGLSTHWAGASAAFAAQYAACLLVFAGGETPAVADCPYLSRAGRQISSAGSLRAKPERQSAPVSVVNLEVGRGIDINRPGGRR
jgi:hypothetical protein